MNTYCFSPLYIANNAVENTDLPTFAQRDRDITDGSGGGGNQFKSLFSILLGLHPEVIFEESSICRATIPFYISKRNGEAFLSPYNLAK